MQQIGSKCLAKGNARHKSAGDFASQQFMSNKTAAIIDGPWQAQTYKENNINYGVAKIPTLNNGQPYQPFGGGKGWVVSNYAKTKTSLKNGLIM